MNSTQLWLQFLGTGSVEKLHTLVQWEKRTSNTKANKAGKQQLIRNISGVKKMRRVQSIHVNGIKFSLRTSKNVAMNANSPVKKVRVYNIWKVVCITIRITVLIQIAKHIIMINTRPKTTYKTYEVAEAFPFFETTCVVDMFLKLPFSIICLKRQDIQGSMWSKLNFLLLEWWPAEAIGLSLSCCLHIAERNRSIRNDVSEYHELHGNLNSAL